MKQPLLFTLLSSAACVATAADKAPKQTTPEKAKTPNVVFIYADDLGYGDLECYGAKNVQTPNVNRLAKSGIRFTNAHATAATSTPSRYSMLTGEYAWRKKGTDVAAGNAGMIIRPEQYTMADMFKSTGYATGAIGKWHLGLGDKAGTQDWNAPLPCALGDLGFDYHYIMAATADRVPCVYIENGKVANYDPSAPIEVSYQRNFEGEPTGKSNPEMLYNLKPSHGHDMSIVNGISRIGFMKGGGKALWKDENIADSLTTHAIQFIEENKDKIIKELKEVYNINLVKIVKDSYYEKYKFAENEMNNGLIEIYGYMDDGQEIEVQYDLVGNYIYYVNYKYW